MIKAVLFDFDGVLVSSKEANVEFVTNVIRANGYPAPSPTELGAALYLPFPDLLRLFTSEKSEQKITEMANTKVPFPHALVGLQSGEQEVLSGLKKKYRLGLVSSALRRFVETDLVRLGLMQHLDTTVTGEDTAAHKPNPAPLLLAARRLGTEPGACVYIGDFPSDVAAAKSAGMKSIFFSNEGAESLGPDACTTRFTELPGIIARM